MEQTIFYVFDARKNGPGENEANCLEYFSVIHIFGTFSHYLVFGKNPKLLTFLTSHQLLIIYVQIQFYFVNIKLLKI